MTAERYWRELSVWDEVGYGLDFAPAKAMSLNNIYVRWFEPADLLDGGGTAAAWDEVAFERRNKTTRSGTAAWRLSRPATIYGLALWWRAELAPGVMLSTGPLDPRTHWEQLYLPALAPIRVEAGQTLRRPPALHDLRRARHQRDLDADRRRHGRARGAAPGPRPREGVSAVSSVIPQHERVRSRRATVADREQCAAVGG